ncbi:hypothetical protein [Streptomyces jumonjinensis]|uniref:Uncharacterized protein n=1 Tax=Streptomyces jumonjinensis TaxID=1945 RepID=A0A646KQ46_STRJU|nr:hypothetical protein [Streptomyces jumonjinensis]MQT03126.1 hypothetical protein [Streptomyces jumonjinensis]
MWRIVRSREYRRLHRHIAILQAALDSATTDAVQQSERSRRADAHATHLSDQLDGAARRLRQYTAAMDVYAIGSEAALVRYETRIDRLARAVARLRAELAKQKRVTSRLSGQLMDSMGYTEAERRLLDAALDRETS